jgi:hypothetical protein
MTPQGPAHDPPAAQPAHLAASSSSHEHDQQADGGACAGGEVQGDAEELHADPSTAAGVGKGQKRKASCIYPEDNVGAAQAEQHAPKTAVVETSGPALIQAVAHPDDARQWYAMPEEWRRATQAVYLKALTTTPDGVVFVPGFTPGRAEDDSDTGGIMGCTCIVTDGTYDGLRDLPGTCTHRILYRLLMSRVLVFHVRDRPVQHERGDGGPRDTA